MTTEAFCLRLSKDCGVAPGAHVLAAVSGGADSTALLCFLCAARERMGLTISCAHVEHGIRGEASLADLAFVQALCARRHVPLYVSRVDAPAFAAREGCGLEDAARRLRYAFLEKTAREIGADAIALAHHAGDQAETVLLHAARGCDMRGLTAMRLRRGIFIRPLLLSAPEELRAFLTAQGEIWREDKTNEDLHYARNRVRRRALPELERACPGAGAALCRLADAARRDEDYFSRQLAALDIALLPLADGVALARERLAALHEALQSRVLARALERAELPASSAALEQTAGLLAAQTGAKAVSLPGGGEARLGERYLCLVRPEAVIADTALPAQGEIGTPFGVFRVREPLPGETGDGRTSQRIPEALLGGARVTARRQGDAMIPFGRGGSVKLKKLMADAGVERAMRRSVPVLRRGETILWAAGLRAGECCRAREGERAWLVEWIRREERL